MRQEHKAEIRARLKTDYYLDEQDRSEFTELLDSNEALLAAAKEARIIVAAAALEDWEAEIYNMVPAILYDIITRLDAAIAGAEK